jgi:hypothetical protein
MFQRHLLSIGIFLTLIGFGTSAMAKDAVVGEKTLPSASQTPVAKKPKEATPVRVAAGKPAVSPAPPEAPVSAPPPVEEKKEKKVEAGYNKGFFIQSPDEKWKLVITGYTQFLFDLENAGGETDFGFQIRRARLSFSGNLGTKKLNYKIQIDLAKFKTELLLDAWLGYKILGESLIVWAGQFDVPWIRQNIISSSNQQFVDRSLATVQFTNVIEQDSDGDGIADKFVRNGRDVGIMLHGKHFENKVEYQGGMFNGSGTNTANLDHGFLFAGRGVYNIRGDAGYEEGDYDHTESPAVYFGASGNYNTRDITNDKAVQVGTETGLKYKGLSAQGEFFYRRKMPNDSLLSKENDFGYYAQVGYFAVPKRLEIAARASQAFLSGFLNDEAEFMVGVNGYLFRKNVKLQTDYSVLPFDTEEGVETTQRFRLQLQSKF